MTPLEWVSTISLSLGIIGIIFRLFILIPLKNFIKEQTYPIQPTSNGGRSLPDVANAIARIESRLDEHMLHHSKDN